VAWDQLPFRARYLFMIIILQRPYKCLVFVLGITFLVTRQGGLSREIPILEGDNKLQCIQQCKLLPALHGGFALSRVYSDKLVFVDNSS
jgi:hypothetical protein